MNNLVVDNKYMLSLIYYITPNWFVLIDKYSLNALNHKHFCFLNTFISKV